MSVDELFAVAGLDVYAQAFEIKAGKLDPDLAKFAARLKMAANLESIEVTGLGEESSQGYLALMKISFAFSALELIARDRAIRGRVSIKHSRLAAKLKTEHFSALQEYLKKSAKTKSMKNDLEKFFSGNSSDLIPVVRAIRNTLFHGVLTPHTGGRPTKARLKVFDELSSVVVKEVNALGLEVIQRRDADRRRYS